ncbi:Zinc finger protein ZAT3 [Cardamine amara subsp. amara]|uniref:Zinc finger protein ZAT3 n=1 Tax=Cardamine amara subsp. amara TaxID=228776 RepID=A0ABD1BIG5_CARAN
MSTPEKKDVDDTEKKNVDDTEKKNVDDKEKKIVDDTEAEKEEDSNDQCSDEEEFPTREIVLGLPALSISQNFGASSGAEGGKEEEAHLMEQAVVAAKLVIAAAEEAVTRRKNDGGGSSEKKKKKKKASRMRKITDINDQAGGSGEGETKKPRRKASALTNPPPGPPECNVCGRGFGSWKAVFGHLRSHKDRNYLGFSPPPTFSAAAEMFTIPGANSAFVLVTAGGGSSGGNAGGGVGGGSASGGEGGRRLEIDLNVEAVEEKEEEATEAEGVAKFDLNKSPPKDEEEKDKAK